MSETLLFVRGSGGKRIAATKYTVFRDADVLSTGVATFVYYAVHHLVVFLLYTFMSNLKMRLEMNSTNENAITPFYLCIFIYKNIVSVNYNTI